MSINDEDWKNVRSNPGPGDEVEIFVAFEHGLIVKEMAVYLVYGQSITIEVESSTNMELEPLAEVNMQPSPNVKVEASFDVEMDL